MPEENIIQLRYLISENRFRYLAAGEYHIREIYKAVKNHYPNLCEDTYLCRDHCHTAHTDPEWHHVVRSKLQQFKRKGIVRHGHTRGYWIFNEPIKLSTQKEELIKLNNEFEAFYKKQPTIITSSYEMDTPNQQIEIYKGHFILQKGVKSINIAGRIYFDWFPIKGVYFEGETSDTNLVITDFISDSDHFKILIDGKVFGETLFINVKFNHRTFIDGTIKGHAVLGDISIPVTSVNFSVPNLREFTGEIVKYKFGNERRTARNRIILENEKYIIHIDKSINYDDKYQLLKKRGGYINLYSGEIINKKGVIKYNDIIIILDSLTTFLTFLNGKRCAPLFIQGYHDNNIIWTDFTPRHIDQYKDAITWPQKNSIEGLNDLWNSFVALRKDSRTRDFIDTVIHWYVEANSNSGYIEGSILMAQVALEYICNWYIVETKKILVGKDGDNISAANKIRILLSQINGSSEIPNAFDQLKSLLNTYKDLSDGVGIFVYIRNSIVHSQEDKRNKLATISNQMKHEALQLAIWYIELSLLFILKFKGKYFNRCSGELWSGDGEIDSPFK